MPGGAELQEKLPDEIFQLVESFTKFIREQKAYRDQKFDVDPILEIGKNTDEFITLLQRVAVESDRNRQIIQQIKDDITKLLRNSELAYSLLRSHLAASGNSDYDTGLVNTMSGISNNSIYNQTNQLNHNDHRNQFANTLSSQYFSELADQLEIRMKAYGEKIKELKMSLDSLNRTYNTDELFKWLKKQHESLGEIAARVYMTHERILEKHSSQCGQ